MQRWALGIDLGGTAVKLAVIEENGEMLDHQRHPTRVDAGPEGIVEHIASLGFSMYDRFKKRLDENLFAGIGLGAPGAVDTVKGTLSYPPNLPGWERYPLKSRLQRMLADTYSLDSSLILENDANIAACGEAVFGAGRMFDDFMMITLGTGVGSGIILDRKLYRGPCGTAGEIGAMTVDYNSQSVHVGIRGSIESLIGKKRIVSMGIDRYRCNERSEKAETFHGKELRDLSPRTLEKAAHHGDTVAKEVWERVGKILGIGLAGVVALMDIRKFVIGGGISGAGDLIFSPAFGQMKAATLPSMHDGMEIVPASLGNKAGVYGAAARCFSSIE
ncbi:ROK family protein [Prosthecochloris sp.]|uniref:ROK family protein n=1 Tax=Prosthecochloris sp. TaxID=290513 RepID=UPI0025E3D994|nr:ROK family protein [Prosthecochloris sp.]